MPWNLLINFFLPQVELKITVDDRDPGGQVQNVFENIATIKLTRRPTPLRVTNRTSRGREWFSRTLHLSYHIVCVKQYYGPDCSVHCVRDSGHYTCTTANGCSPTSEHKSTIKHIFPLLGVYQTHNTVIIYTVYWEIS